MGLFTSKYDQLIYDYQRLVGGIAHVHRGDYGAHDAKITDAGVAIIAFERETKIREAREDLAVERTIASQVACLEKVLHRYSGLSEAEEALVAGLVDGSISPEEVESRANRIENFDKILKVTKEGLKRLEEWSSKIASRKAKLPKGALTDARKADPLSRNEREMYEGIYDSQRADRATSEYFSQINKPEPAFA